MAWAYISPGQFQFLQRHYSAALSFTKFLTAKRSLGIASLQFGMGSLQPCTVTCFIQDA